jgi:hypothetical protein
VLRKRNLVVGKAHIIAARVPIIKCNLAVDPGRSIAADISLGVGNGPLAVPFILGQVWPDRDHRVHTVPPCFQALAASF